LDSLFYNPEGIDDGYIRADGTTKEFAAASGWHFGSGNPEFWRYSGQLVVPGGSVLDIGMEYGRSSFYFAAQGMSVRGLDTRSETVDKVNEMVASLKDVIDVDMVASVSDALEKDLGHEEYDLVLLDNTVHHFPSKALAVTLIDKAYKAVKPGGHMWVRALGKETDSYTEMREAAKWGDPSLEVIDDDVIMHPCGCSGEYRLDPSLFFGQTDVLHHFISAGARIVHSQLMPEKGRRNIMYGEDFNPGQITIRRGGLTTVLAQKPA
jgi:SAM-dependent methyltransferase